MSHIDFSVKLNLRTLALIIFSSKLLLIMILWLDEDYFRREFTSSSSLFMGTSLASLWAMAVGAFMDKAYCGFATKLE